MTVCPCSRRTTVTTIPLAIATTPRPPNRKPATSQIESMVRRPRRLRVGDRKPAPEGLRPLADRRSCRGLRRCRPSFSCRVGERCRWSSIACRLARTIRDSGSPIPSRRRIARAVARRGRWSAPREGGGLALVVLRAVRVPDVWHRVRGSAAAALFVQQSVRRVPDVPRLRQHHRARHGSGRAGSLEIDRAERDRTVEQAALSVRSSPS